MAGYAEVMNQVLSSWRDIPFTENHIKQLHQMLLRYSEKDTRHRGNYKTHSNSVAVFDENGAQIGIVFQTATPFDTPRLMTELVDWVNQERGRAEQGGLLSGAAPDAGNDSYRVAGLAAVADVFPSLEPSREIQANSNPRQLDVTKK